VNLRPPQLPRVGTSPSAFRNIPLAGNLATVLLFGPWTKSVATALRSKCLAWGTLTVACLLSAPAMLAQTITLSNLGANQITLNLTSTTTSTGYFTIVTGSASCGSAAQTESGESSNAAAAYRIGSLALTANVASAYTVGSLVASTAFTACFTPDGTTAPVTQSFTTNPANVLTSAAWETSGDLLDVSANAAYYESLAFSPNGTPYVAYQDVANSSKVTVKEFDGTSWVTVGNAGFSAGEAIDISLAFSPSGTPYVAYSDGGNSNKATVKKFNGTSWVVVGSAGFSAGTAYSTSLAFSPSGTPYVAYQDGNASSDATVKEFNGTSWVTVGSVGFSAGAAFYTSLAFSPSGTPYVAYQDRGTSNDAATVMEFNGTSWATVGSAGFSAGQAAYTSLAFSPSGTPYVAYQDLNGGYRAMVMEFNGTSWVTAGDADFSEGAAYDVSLAFSPSGTPYVAYYDEITHDGTNTIVPVVMALLAPDPTVTTGAASSITGTTATLNGVVSDNGSTSSVSFDYGTTTSYGTNVAATTPSSGTVTAGSGSTAAAVNITGLTTGTVYHFRVDATENNETVNGSDATFTPLIPQIITFPQPTSPAQAGTTATLTATASSGLAITYSVASGPATVSGSTVTYTGTGTVVLEADQSGNGSYSAAPAVQQTVTVLDSESVGMATGTLTATVTFTTAGTPSTIVATTQGTAVVEFTLLSVGTCSTSTAYTVGQVCTVQYTFTPKAPGMRRGAVILKNGSGVVLGESLLSGIGTGPQGLFQAGVSSHVFSTTLNVPRSLSVDAAGNVYLANQSGDTILKFAAGSTSPTTLETATANTSNAAVDGAGNVYYSTTGGIYELVGGTGTPVQINSTITSADNNLSVDGSGNLFTSDSSNGAIYEIAAVTHSNSTLISGGSGYRFIGMSIDSNGNLFMADYSNSKLWELVCTSGTYAASLTPLYTGTPLANPHAVTVDAADNVYVSNVGGTYAYRFAAGSYGATPTTLSVQAEQGLAIGPDGSIYTIVGNTLTQYSRTTAPSLTFASTVVGASSAAQSVVFENDGNAALTISSLTAGESNANFSGTGTTCSTSSMLATAATCNMGVVFAPSSVANPLAGTAVVTDNSLNNSSSMQTVPVSGVSTKGTATFGTMSFSPAAIEGQGTSQVVTISDTVTYGGVQPTGAVKFVLHSVTYTATCTTAGSPETCSYAVPAATIAAFAVGSYIVTTALTADTNYNSATGTSGSFSITADAFASLSVGGYITTATLTESGTVTVTAKNSNGTTDPLFTGTVTLTSSDAHATLPAAYTFQSSDAGVHVFTVTLNTLGTQSITATSGSVSGLQASIMAGDAIWLVNAAGTLVKLNEAATPITTGIGTSGTAGTKGGVAFDSSGNAWSVSSASNTLNYATSVGISPTTYSGGGLSTPVAAAVDGQGYIWVANSGNASISGFKPTGTPLGGTYGLGADVPGLPTTGTAPIGAAPSAIAVDNAGGIWVTAKTGNSVTHIVGVASPVTTPTATAVTNGTVGMKP